MNDFTDLPIRVRDYLAKGDGDPTAMLGKLCPNMCRRARKCHSRADLRQACFVGLLNAARNFDSSRGNKFATYAVYHLMHQVRNMIYRPDLDYRHRGERHVGGWPTDATGEAVELADPRAADPVEVVTGVGPGVTKRIAVGTADAAAVRKAVRRAVGTGWNMAKLIDRMFGLDGGPGAKAAQAGRTVGLDRARSGQVWRDARQRIKRELLREGFTDDTDRAAGGGVEVVPQTRPGESLPVRVGGDRRLVRPRAGQAGGVAGRVKKR